jgi:hypothetical protein
VIEAPKSSQQLPPQSYLKVLRRTHHREIQTLLPQKARLVARSTMQAQREYSALRQLAVYGDGHAVMLFCVG